MTWINDLKCVVLLILSYFSNVSVSFIHDECRNYKTLPDDRDRSNTNTLAPPDPNNIPCDDAFTGWYRLHSGVIATSCVPENHCGTSSTIWMKDPIPGVLQRRENKFCVDHKSSQGEPCCLFSLKINVTNCGGYLVYQLHGGDLLCPSGYCTENITACPPGMTSFSGFEPCTPSHPVMEGSPILGAPVIINNGQDFSQTCSVDYIGTDGEFKLEWFFDGVLYKTVILTNGTLNHTLYANDWIGHVGQQLECQVTSYYDYDDINATHSKALISNSYFGGITISPDTLTISERRPEQMVLTSTLPVVCDPNMPGDAQDCTLMLSVEVTGQDPNGILVQDGCSLELRSELWEETFGTISYNITLATSIDTLFKPMAEYFVNLYFETDANFTQNMWTNYNVTNFKVFRKEGPTNICLAFGQSHIASTMPGKTNIFHNGDFLLFQEENNDGDNLQVQIRFWSPSGHAPSICAVAVQYNEALVIVDMCTENENTTAPVITQGDSDPDDVRVYLCGSSYRILMGDGTRVIIFMHELNLDVKLEIPPSYSFKHAEACKFLTTKEISPWSQLLPFVLNKNTSLFLEAGRRFFDVSNGAVPTVRSYCACSRWSSNCDPFLRVKDPLCTMLPNKQMRCESECVLIAPRTINPEASMFQVQDPAETKLPPTRWANMLKSGVIQQRCQTTILNHSSPICHQFTVARNIISAACLEDYLFSRGFDYIQSSVLAFQASCENALFAQKGNYYTRPDGRQTLEEILLNQICPDVCNLHGQCVNGSCDCDHGYSGKDCSNEENGPPTILGILGGSTCLLSYRYCLQPILATRNVGNNMDLVAKIQHIHPPTSNLTEIFLEPVYENKFSVSLPMAHLPSLFREQSAYTLSIEISNDGQIFSNAVNYTVYDDECLLCGDNLDSCVLKTSACHIKGVCYSLGETNPRNNSQVCNPDYALKQWSHVGM